MADFSVTINTGLRVFGIAPASQWGAYNWGAFLWGEGTTDLATAYEKQLSDTLSSDSAISERDIWHELAADAVTLSADMGSEALFSGGYSYVFPDRVTEGESRTFTSWSSGTATQPAWTSATASQTTWS